MAQILCDREIKKLLESDVILDGDVKQIRSNSYLFRLGKEVRFLSVNERKIGELGNILEIGPSDSAMIISLEKLNFHNVENLYKGKQLCGFLTPPTTLIREGVQLPSTKIDPGFRGSLNWTIKNSSLEPLKLEIGEPIFKCTFMLLTDEEEIPDLTYGEREEVDFYQDQTGLGESKRRLPVGHEKRTKIAISSAGSEYQRLTQAGFPYDFIGTQLKQLGGDLQLVTKDFARINEQIGKVEEKIIKDINKDVNAIITTKLLYSGSAVFTVMFALGAFGKYLMDAGKSNYIAPSLSILAIASLLIIVAFHLLRKQ